MANIGDYHIKDYSADVLRAEENAVEKVLTEIGLHIEGQAKKALSQPPKRIDTGLLRNSITFALSGEPAAEETYYADTGSKSGSYKGKAPGDKPFSNSVYIGTNVEYAA